MSTPATDFTTPAPQEFSVAEIRARRVELASIQKTLLLHKLDRGGPRMQMLMTASTRSGLGIFAVMLLLTMMGRDLNIFVFFAPVAFLPPALISYFRWTGPKSWAEVLDPQLAAYQPVNRTAFRHLQEDLRRAGQIVSSMVDDWLEAEKAALDAAQFPPFRPTSFLERKL